MDFILSFFADLILFTAGLVVAGLWIAAFVVMIIEIYDLFADRSKKIAEEE